MQQNVVSINSSITRINSEITQVKKLIADEINSTKGDITWLQGKVIQCTTLRADNVRANAIMTINGNAVATQTWVNQKRYLTALPSHRHTVKVGTTNYFTSYTGS